MLAALLSAAAGALLDVTKFQPPAPCNTATAATLAGDAVLAETPDDAVWFSVMPSVGIPAAPVDLSTLSDWNTPEAPLPMVVGPKPIAVGRLVLSAARIDRLVCALAQEDDDHDACLQAVVDACLRRWVGHVAEADACASHTADAPPEFEDLVACASYYSKNACERLGFVEEEAPDLAVRPVVTHRARLPAVVLAYKTLGENDALLEKLRELPAPTDTRATAPPPPPAKDPWLRTDGKGLGML